MLKCFLSIGCQLSVLLFYILFKCKDYAIGLTLIVKKKSSITKFPAVSIILAYNFNLFMNVLGVFQTR